MRLLALLMLLACPAAAQEGQLRWFVSLQHSVTVAQHRGDDAAALALLDRFVTAGRASPWAADIMGVAADKLFELHQYPAMSDALSQMVALGGTMRSFTSLDALYAAQGQAEVAGRVEDASALIDARVTVVRVVQPDMAKAFAHAALWHKFFINEQAGLYGPAADALRAWSATGQMTAEERAFVEAQASDSLLYTELASYAARRVTQLGNAQLALAYADVLQDPRDLRRARALRALASAQTGLGQLAAAGATLQDALGVVEAAGGQADRFWVLEDLAANAWARGNAAQAQQVFDVADALDGAALARMDQVIGLQNRARLATDLGDISRARALLARAWALFKADQAAGAQKANTRAIEVALLITEAGVDELAGRGALAMEAAQRAVQVAEGIWPQDHPDMAVALGQAAGVLARLGDHAGAMALLRRADAINAATLPFDTPSALEIKQSMAELALIAGDRPGAIAALRAAALGRKSPAYRASLPEGEVSFAMLAWALLAQDRPDEAFEALQWTQITQSAEALAQMQQRLAASSPLRDSLIRQAQDLALQSARNRSDLMAAYASGAATAPLRAREAGLAAAFARSDAALAAAGLEMTGVAAVDPVPLAQVQRLLAPDEALVTFVVPGLRPDVVAGLGGSSNYAIAVTREGVRFARIPVAARGVLQAQITAFRCQIALDDACGAGSAQTRGAMVLDGAVAQGFDPEPGQALYRALFGGIEPALQGKAHLIIVPPGDMLRLPFQALVTGEVVGQVPWLLRRYAVSVLPSVPSFRTLRGAVALAAKRLLGVGDPMLAAAHPVDCAAQGLQGVRSAAQAASLRALPGLPDASCEIHSIAGAYPGPATVLLQAQATEGRIKAMNATGALQGYDTLVFATHGLLAGQLGSVEPALVLTPPDRPSDGDDGLLTASEIASLILHARLVILSACNTASGDGHSRDGLSGLARAFFQAGATSLLVTHWSVYSRAATQISTGYVALAGANPALRPSEVLRQVLLRLIDGDDALARTPPYWAAFAMVGAD